MIKNTLTGGVTVNDIMLHAIVPNLPFGGVGDSGTRHPNDLLHKQICSERCIQHGKDTYHDIICGKDFSWLYKVWKGADQAYHPVYCGSKILTSSSTNVTGFQIGSAYWNINNLLSVCYVLKPTVKWDISNKLRSSRTRPN